MRARIPLGFAFCAAALLSLVSAFARDESPRRTAVATSIALPSGRVLLLPGEWTETKTLGGSHALVATRTDGMARELVSLDAGASEPRTIARFRSKSGGSGLGIAWEPDASSCYAWIDEVQQLCRFDATTGV